MTADIIQLPSVSPVAPSSNAVVILPIGPRYMGVNFQCSGTALASSHIGKIEVRMNGVVQMEFKDLDRLILFNAYYGRPTDTVTNWSIYFDRAELVDLVQRRMPGIGTRDLKTLDIKITLTSSFPADGEIKAYAMQDQVEENLGAFVKVREFTIPDPGTTGEVEIDRIPRADYCLAMHFFKADVTNVRLKINRNGKNEEKVDAPKAVLERFQKNASPLARVPQTASATHVDFILEGNLYDALQLEGLSGLRVLPTIGTAGAFDTVVEYLGGLNTGA